MNATHALTHSFGPGRRSRLLLIALVLTIAVIEVLAIYVVLPGRVPVSFTAVQPDSVAYICQALRMSTLDSVTSARISGELFQAFGYDPAACTSTFAINQWYVISRPLLPALIAMSTSMAATPSATLVPSILIFAAFVILWLRMIAPSTRPLQLLDWAIAIAPFAAITMILWPAGVLTEGPIVVLSLLAVAVIDRGFRARGLSNLGTAVLLVVIGLAFLLTRQSWPVVGALWSAGLAMAISTRWPGGRARMLMICLGSAVLGFLVAKSLAGLIEELLVPAGLKETQKYWPEGIVLEDVPEILWSSIMSTAEDIGIAVSRGDIISPIVLIAGVVAAIALFRMRAWSLAWICAVTWVLGMYSVGLVQVFDHATRTHLRYLVPAIIMSLGAWSVARRRFREGQPAFETSPAPPSVGNPDPGTETD